MKALLLSACLMLPVPAWADGLQTALQLSARHDWAGARNAVQSDVARDIIEWQRLREGEGKARDYEAFLARRPDWPGLALLRQKGEAEIAVSGDADRILAYFAAQAPQTAKGAIALSRAYLALDRAPEAQAEALRAWRNLSLSADEQDELSRMYPVPIAGEDIPRTDRLLWDGRRAEAERMIPRLSAGWQALVRARIALRADESGVNELIAAVPAQLADQPGLAYERFAWRMRKGLYPDAAELILSHSPDALGHPDMWAPRRIYLVREFEETDPELAYRLASSHGLTEGGDFADLEFLAGHIALRRLNRPADALEHFRHLEQGVGTAISLSRALYWQGRAQEAMGQYDAAMATFQKAATHSSAYYGLLAAERLGLKTDPLLLAGNATPDWRTAPFMTGSVMQAARLLLEAGDFQQGRRFILHLAESQDATGLAQLSDMALAIDQPNIALNLAKMGAGRGIILPAAYYPIPDLVPDGLPVTRAFALAISRRESEFDPAVVSPAGARGLMQVMPETAKKLANGLGADFSTARLTADPAFNVRLGSTYLAQMIEEFGPAVSLVASGYNAGPGRPRQWIAAMGDPRDPAVDVVDWVEDIPYAETRSYVQRVVESLVIYRARLAGVPVPVRVTDELRG
ncbi:lytic transglycosylase domain-containing protein [Falsirhodobacter sp. 20TX0035]|uniref:lytic transglycosylase domain-containing protein n=1 Tax=Falsirhodobacter sp. 20TX0035 TaxID=3022019 RepID=UPI00232AF395|nr:lytic transglycosylase domain-containing protein [Falsirhodobacter sp. 20TX0035]MDB6453996.1 lytic transglycosylase domain-containing protein [Falsirhodobacter sp. 20TX0035]